MSDQVVTMFELFGKKWGTIILLVVVIVSSVSELVIERRNHEEIEAIVAFNTRRLHNEAIVAYESKIFTVDDLQPLTQNGLAVRDGLEIPEIREALFIMDPERTLLFERFFDGQ